MPELPATLSILRYNKFGFDFYLVDTAGIRKKNKVNEDLEYYSVVRSIRSIEGSDVCILMLDATRGVEGQDLNIFSLIQKNQKGLVVVINKWDLVEDKSVKVQKAFENLSKDKTVIMIAHHYQRYKCRPYLCFERRSDRRRRKPRRIIKE